MTKNQIEWLVFITLILVTLAAFAAADQRDSLKEEAVKRGFAEWIVISNNNTEFKWKDPQL